MMQLRYVAIAVVLLAGCRKEPRPAPAGGSGSAQVAAADAAPVPDAPEAPADAGAAADAGDSRDAGVPGSLPAQGEPCSPDGKCQTGLTCVEYFGIAGPRGPKFTSCEIRCGEGSKCPTRQSCVTIADGPGQVCRP